MVREALNGVCGCVLETTAVRPEEGWGTMRNYLTIGETARRLDLGVDTVRKLEKRGRIRAVRTQGGHRRFTEEEILRYQDDKRGRKRKRGRQRLDHPRGVHDTSRADAMPRPAGRGDTDTSDGWDDYSGADVLLGDSCYQQPPPRSPQPSRATTVPLTLPADATFRGVLQVVTDYAMEQRLKTIKNYGRAAIPWDAPGDSRGKVVLDLEQFVTLAQFPSDLSLTDAVNIVRARVAGVMRPYLEAVEKAEQAQKAEKEAERQRQSLIARGKQHAALVTRDWDRVATAEACSEVAKVLVRDVRHDWTDLELTDAVDDILDDWEDSDEDEL